MNVEESWLPQPQVAAPLHPGFRPAVLAHRSFRAAARATGCPVPVGIALEQSDGSISVYRTELLPEGHPAAVHNARHLERLCKFLLWARGGFRLHIAGPVAVCDALRRHYYETAVGRFDAQIMGDRIYERTFEVVHARELPPERTTAAALGRHLDGCRIGFDLGGSDRKVAAVMDGRVVFSEETVWSPVTEPDPAYHYAGIMESLRRAAAHLPRVDAIGGSAAGVYVNNRVKVASLFRAVPPALFNTRVKDLFLELKKAWNGIPFEVVNDGEVTALAGSMALGANGVLGIAMGTSQAGGFVTPAGTITTWLNELAFAPVDMDPGAPADEWSGDLGCGVQYFSQQAVGRLLGPAGIVLDAALPLPEKLKAVQQLMAAGDERAQRIYRTIGVYLGYAIAHYADFYDFGHVLVLGRVTSGTGGDLLLEEARRVLAQEFPELAAGLSFHVPDETEKRHGQAIAAASLPALKP